MLGNFAYFFASADFFFQNETFSKIISLKSLKQFGLYVRPDQVQTVCKGYQQKTLVDIVSIIIFFVKVPSSPATLLTPCMPRIFS